MKQMEVTIMGQSYVLACPAGGEEALSQAVARVDAEMAAIRESGKVKSRERIAVLAALNLAFVRGDELPPAPAPAVQAALPLSEGTTLGAVNAAGADIERLIRRIDEQLGSELRAQ